MSVAILTAARDAALAALDADDYQEARKQALKAQMVIATVPDSSIASVSSQSWGRAAIAQFLEGVDSLEKAAAAADDCGITVCDVEFGSCYGERGDCGGCSC
ncbi:MAG: hypothetical protein ABJZ55_16105 [Fuerstiella sp.]